MSSEPPLTGVMRSRLRAQIALMRAHRKTIEALLERDKWLTREERAALAHAVTSYSEGADMLEETLRELGKLD